MKHVEVLFQQFCLFSSISNVFQMYFKQKTFTCSLWSACVVKLGCYMLCSGAFPNPFFAGAFPNSCFWCHACLWCCSKHHTSPTMCFFQAPPAVFSKTYSFGFWLKNLPTASAKVPKLFSARIHLWGWCWVLMGYTSSPHSMHSWQIFRLSSKIAMASMSQAMWHLPLCPTWAQQTSFPKSCSWKGTKVWMSSSTFSALLSHAT